MNKLQRIQGLTRTGRLKSRFVKAQSTNIKIHNGLDKEKI